MENLRISSIWSDNLLQTSLITFHLSPLSGGRRGGMGGERGDGDAKRPQPLEHRSRGLVERSAPQESAKGGGKPPCQF